MMEEWSLQDNRGDPNQYVKVRKRRSRNRIGFLLFVASSSLPAPGKFTDTHYEWVNPENFGH